MARKSLYQTVTVKNIFKITCLHCANEVVLDKPVMPDMLYEHSTCVRCGAPQEYAGRFLRGVLTIEEQVQIAGS